VSSPKSGDRTRAEGRVCRGSDDEEEVLYDGTPRNRARLTPTREEKRQRYSRGLKILGELMCFLACVLVIVVCAYSAWSKLSVPVSKAAAPHETSLLTKCEGPCDALAKGYNTGQGMFVPIPSLVIDMTSEWLTVRESLAHVISSIYDPNDTINYPIRDCTISAKRPMSCTTQLNFDVAPVTPYVGAVGPTKIRWQTTSFTGKNRCNKERYPLACFIRSLIEQEMRMHEYRIVKIGRALVDEVYQRVTTFVEDLAKVAIWAVFSAMYLVTSFYATKLWLLKQRLSVLLVWIAVVVFNTSYVVMLCGTAICSVFLGVLYIRRRMEKKANSKKAAQFVAVAEALVSKSNGRMSFVEAATWLVQIGMTAPLKSMVQELEKASATHISLQGREKQLALVSSLGYTKEGLFVKKTARGQRRKKTGAVAKRATHHIKNHGYTYANYFAQYNSGTAEQVAEHEAVFENNNRTLEEVEARPNIGDLHPNHGVYTADGWDRSPSLWREMVHMIQVTIAVERQASDDAAWEEHQRKNWDYGPEAQGDFETEEEVQEREMEEHLERQAALDLEATYDFIYGYTGGGKFSTSKAPRPQPRRKLESLRIASALLGSFHHIREGLSVDLNKHSVKYKEVLAVNAMRDVRAAALHRCLPHAKLSDFAEDDNFEVVLVGRQPCPTFSRKGRELLYTSEDAFEGMRTKIIWSVGQEKHDEQLKLAKAAYEMVERTIQCLNGTEVPVLPTKEGGEKKGTTWKGSPGNHYGMPLNLCCSICGQFGIMPEHQVCDAYLPDGSVCGFNNARRPRPVDVNTVREHYFKGKQVAFVRDISTGFLYMHSAVGGKNDVYLGEMKKFSSITPLPGSYPVNAENLAEWVSGMTMVYGPEQEVYKRRAANLVREYRDHLAQVEKRGRTGVSPASCSTSKPKGVAAKPPPSFQAVDVAQLTSKDLGLEEEDDCDEPLKMSIVTSAPVPKPNSAVNAAARVSGKKTSAKPEKLAPPKVSPPVPPPKASPSELPTKAAHSVPQPKALPVVPPKGAVPEAAASKEGCVAPIPAPPIVNYVERRIGDAVYVGQSVTTQHYTRFCKHVFPQMVSAEEASRLLGGTVWCSAADRHGYYVFPNNTPSVGKKSTSTDNVVQVAYCMKNGTVKHTSGVTLSPTSATYETGSPISDNDTCGRGSSGCAVMDKSGVLIGFHESYYSGGHKASNFARCPTTVDFHKLTDGNLKEEFIACETDPACTAQGLQWLRSRKSPLQRVANQIRGFAHLLTHFLVKPNADRMVEEVENFKTVKPVWTPDAKSLKFVAATKQKVAKLDKARQDQMSTDFSYFKSELAQTLMEVDLSTGVGFPLVQYYSNKREWVEKEGFDNIAEECWDVFQDLLDGVDPSFAYWVFMKEDKYSAKKVEVQKYRTIQSASVVMLLLLRTYYRDTYRYLKVDYAMTKNECGIDYRANVVFDPFDIAAWTAKVKWLTGSQPGVTYGLDYTQFDRNIRQGYWETFFETIGGNMNFRKIMAKSAACGDFYSAGFDEPILTGRTRGNPSGHPFTTVFNNFVNGCMLSEVVPNGTRVMTTGDDCLLYSPVGTKVESVASLLAAQNDIDVKLEDKQLFYPKKTCAVASYLGCKTVSIPMGNGLMCIPVPDSIKRRISSCFQGEDANRRERVMGCASSVLTVELALYHLSLQELSDLVGAENVTDYVLFKKEVIEAYPDATVFLKTGVMARCFRYHVESLVWDVATQHGYKIRDEMNGKGKQPGSASQVLKTLPQQVEKSVAKALEADAHKHQQKGGSDKLHIARLDECTRLMAQMRKEMMEMSKEFADPHHPAPERAETRFVDVNVAASIAPQSADFIPSCNGRDPVAYSVCRGKFEKTIDLVAGNTLYIFDAAAYLGYDISTGTPGVDPGAVITYQFPTGGSSVSGVSVTNADISSFNYQIPSHVSPPIEVIAGGTLAGAIPYVVGPGSWTLNVVRKDNTKAYPATYIQAAHSAGLQRFSADAAEYNQQNGAGSMYHIIPSAPYAPYSVAGTPPFPLNIVGSELEDLKPEFRESFAGTFSMYTDQNGFQTYWSGLSVSDAGVSISTLENETPFILINAGLTDAFVTFTLNRQFAIPVQAQYAAAHPETLYDQPWKMLPNLSLHTACGDTGYNTEQARRSATRKMIHHCANKGLDVHDSATSILSGCKKMYDPLLERAHSTGQVCSLTARGNPAKVRGIGRRASSANEQDLDIGQIQGVQRAGPKKQPKQRLGSSSVSNLITTGAAVASVVAPEAAPFIAAGVAVADVISDIFSLF
jgi:hypothetical protein